MDPNLLTPEAKQKSNAAPPSDHPKLETKRILLYLAITFILTYAVEILIISPILQSDNPELASIAQRLVSSVMFIPAIAVIITRLITKEGFRNSLLRLPNLKDNLLYYLISWLGPAMLALIGASIYFIIFSGDLDLELTIIGEYYKSGGVSLTTTELQNAMRLQIIIAILLGPLLNLITCMGEEWGWRGYLLPKMMGKFSIIPVLLINGVIWGLWHAPLTVLGHNYGIGYFGYPYTGILAMILFCIVIGTIFSYLTIKTNSCFPAAFAHGSLNAIGSAGIYFSKSGGNPFIGPGPTGVIGGLLLIVAAVIMVNSLLKNGKASSKSQSDKFIL
jgi:membrane protease YdiL (CAAX protease family)